MFYYAKGNYTAAQQVKRDRLKLIFVTIPFFIGPVAVPTIFIALAVSTAALGSLFHSVGQKRAMALPSPATNSAAANQSSLSWITASAHQKPSVPDSDIPGLEGPAPVKAAKQNIKTVSEPDPQPAFIERINETNDRSVLGMLRLQALQVGATEAAKQAEEKLVPIFETAGDGAAKSPVSPDVQIKNLRSEALRYQSTKCELAVVRSAFNAGVDAFNAMGKNYNKTLADIDAGRAGDVYSARSQAQTQKAKIETEKLRMDTLKADLAALKIKAGE